MENFGLGLIINFKDEASESMEKLISTFEKLSTSFDDIASHAAGSVEQINAIATSMGVLGAAVSAMGMALSAPFVKLGEAVVKTGDNYEKTRITLQSMYKDADIAKAKLDWAMNFAAHTPFNMEDLVPAMVRMKGIGVEADKDMVSIDGMHQKFLSYVGDLAALRPDKGIKLAVQGVQEYLEGNTRGLKMMFGMNPKELLGEKIAGDKEARMQQFVDMISKLNASGLMQNLNGTWSHMISNMEDQWDRLKLAISDAGFFQKMKSNLESAFNVINDLSNEDVANAGKVLSDVLITMTTPLTWLAGGITKIIGFFKEMANEYPVITKFILTFIAMSGVIMTLAGAGLVVGAVFIRLRTALLATYGVASLTTYVLTILRTGMYALVRSVMPVVATASLLYYAWSTNMFGIRNNTLRAFKDIARIFEIVEDAWADNTLSRKNYNMAVQMGILPFISALLQAKYYVGIFFGAVKEGFENGTEYIKQLGDKFTILSELIEDSTNKGTEFFHLWIDPGHEEAIKSIGFAVGDWLPIILMVAAGVKMLQIGWGLVAGAVTIAREAVEIFIAIVYPFFEVVGQGLAKVFSVFIDIAKYGRVAYGVIADIVVDLAGMFGVMSEGVTFTSALAVWFPRIYSAVSSILPVVTAIGEAFVFVGEVVLGILSAFGVVVSLPAWAVGAIGAVVVAGVALIIAYWDELCEFLSTALSPVVQAVEAFGEFLYQLFRAVFWTIADLATGTWELVGMGLYVLYSATIAPVVEAVGQVFDALCGMLKQLFMAVWNFIKANFIDPFLTEASNVCAIVSDKFNQLASDIQSAFGSVQDFVSGVFDWCSKAFDGLIDKAKELKDSFLNLLPSLPSLSSITGSIASYADSRKSSTISRWATGGEIGDTEGIAYLDPNEVVINGTLTQGLRDFVDDWKNNAGSVVPKESNNAVPYSFVGDGGSSQDTIPVVSGNTSEAPSGGDSFTFSEGSIVIKLEGTGGSTVEEAEQLAETLMAIIDRKIELKKMLRGEGE